MGRYSTAHYFLEGLVDPGVEYIFANLGTVPEARPQK